MGKCKKNMTHKSPQTNKQIKKYIIYKYLKGLTVRCPVRVFRHVCLNTCVLKKSRWLGIPFKVRSTGRLQTWGDSNPRTFVDGSLNTP